MVTINENLERLTKDDVVRISNEYLMGWHNLSKTYGFTLRGLNNKRVLHGLDKISKDISFDYRLEYIRNKYTMDVVAKELLDYMRVTKMDEARWSGIELFDCRFGEEFAKFFKQLLGKDVYKELSESARVEKLTKTQTELYGGVGLAGEATRLKARNTLMETKGVSNPMFSKEVKDKLADTNIEIYGGISPFSSADVQDKGMMSKLKKVEEAMVEYKENGNMDESIFKDSPIERIVFYELVDRFGKEDVYYQYGIHPYDERYPYPCDFYIKSLDLFIEINHHYTHGDHWFSETNEDDILILEDLRELNTIYSNRYIRTWTEQDVKKRMKAKDEKLNYLVFWDNTYHQRNHERIPNLTDFNIWLNDYDCDVDQFLQNHPENTY